MKVRENKHTWMNNAIYQHWYQNTNLDNVNVTSNEMFD